MAGESGRLPDGGSVAVDGPSVGRVEGEPGEPARPSFTPADAGDQVERREAGDDGVERVAPPRKRRRPRKRWSALERELRAATGPLLAGIDEVGRGPLAGPVVACAVIMPPEGRAIRGVDDSKRLTGAQRERLVSVIVERAVAIGIGAASVREIDRINIYQASVLAMRRAVARLRMAPDHLLVDGKQIRTLGMPHTAVVGGDAKCYSVACASIVAKVTRDRLMTLLAARYPVYRWDRNVGYATSDHVRALDVHGPTAHHRRSFVRVSQLMLALGTDLLGEDAIAGEVMREERATNA